MQRLTVLVTAFALTLICPLAVAQQEQQPEKSPQEQRTGIPAKHHPWGRFSPGAWKEVRVISETLDEKGLVASRSITETRTTLLEVEAKAVKLLVEVSIEVAGKRFDTEPETVHQEFLSDMECDELEVEEREDKPVVIEGREIPCRVFRLECSGPKRETRTTVYYCPTVAPYTLRRESTTTDSNGNGGTTTTVVEVVARNMPCEVLGKTKSASLVRVVRKRPKGKVVTWAYTSPEVPGGIIRHSSKELGPNGRPTRRSTLDLLNYGRKPPEDRLGITGRRRPGRLLPFGRTMRAKSGRWMPDAGYRTPSAGCWTLDAGRRSSGVRRLSTER